LVVVIVAIVVIQEGYLEKACLIKSKLVSFFNFLQLLLDLLHLSSKREDSTNHETVKRKHYH
jgi:hypothetical protein